MAEFVVKFDVRFSRVWIRNLTALAMVLAIAPELASESVTLTTYYPAPSGVYTNMIVTGATYLARDGGAVGVQTATPTGGYVMDVNGSLLVRANEQVNGNLSVGGTFTVNNLTVNNLTVNTSLTDNGTAVFNGNTTVNNAITGNYGLTPGYVSWGTYGTGSGGAAIYNDAGGFKALMLVGNNSAGNGYRQVQVYDDLTVNGYTNSIITTANQNCASVNVNLNGTAPGCGAGNYLTTISGMYARLVAVGNPYTYVATNPTNAIDALCCQCPHGGVCLY